MVCGIGFDLIFRSARFQCSTAGDKTIKNQIQSSLVISLCLCCCLCNQYISFLIPAIQSVCYCISDYWCRFDVLFNRIVELQVVVVLIKIKVYQLLRLIVVGIAVCLVLDFNLNDFVESNNRSVIL